MARTDVRLACGEDMETREVLAVLWSVSGSAVTIKAF